MENGANSDESNGINEKVDSNVFEDSRNGGALNNSQESEEEFELETAAVAVDEEDYADRIVWEILDNDSNVLRHFLMRYRVELCVFVAVFFSVLTTYLQASGMVKPKLQLRRQAPAQRFFSLSSPVVDIYHGNGVQIHELLNNGEFVFVMYYAPWSVRCTEARFHFDRLARTFEGGVHFFAVNCWDPGGQCKNLYKMYTYPVFILYSATSFRGLYYNGVFSADYMYRFLKNVVDPYVKLDSVSDVDRYLLSSDISTVLVYFKFAQTSLPSGFESFHWATLKALEQDPFGDQIRFALITDSNVAQYFNMTKNASIRFYNWSSSFESFVDFPYDGQIKSDALVKWIFTLTTDKIQWYHGSDNSKSEILQQSLSNATIVLFTPRLPLYSTNGDYLSFLTTAMKYYDCQDSPFIDRTLNVMRRRHEAAYSNNERWKELCGEGRYLSTFDCCRDVVVAKTYSSHRNICDVCLPVTPPKDTTTSLLEISKNNENAVFSKFSYDFDEVCKTFSPGAKLFMDTFASSIITTSRSCDEMSQYLRINKLVEYCCGNSQWKSSHDTSAVSSLILYDGQSYDDLLAYCAMSSKSNSNPRQRSTLCNLRFDKTLPSECKKLKLMKILNYTTLSPFANADRIALDNRGKREFRGLSCSTNKTLKFLAIDSRHHGYFAEKLGISTRAGSALAIFDRKEETVYDFPHTEKLSENSISNFITNYTNSRLKRFLKTEHLLKSHNHNGQSWTNCDDLMYRICIDKVTTANFNRKILQRKQDVVLLYTTTWCGLCNQVHHIYQSLAYYFRFIPQTQLSFAMIDADKNDLPWQYTADAYPTILYFPGRNVNESVAFPRRLPMTLPNLISFVLANCAWRIRLEVAISACSKRCLVGNVKIISDQLKKYQRTLSRLQALAVEKEYLWQWVDDDPDFGPLIPSYLTGIWKDIAQTEVKIRTLRLLLRFLWASDKSLMELDALNRTPFNLDDFLSFLHTNNVTPR